MNYQGRVFDLGMARITREKVRQLEVFIDCKIDDSSADNFIKVLTKNNMLYYFDEEAEDAVDDNDEHIFTYKQALLLNVIRNRFKEHPLIYSRLFNEVETNFAQYCVI